MFNVRDGVRLGGWFDFRRACFTFELSVSQASIISTTDPDEMGGFQVSGCHNSLQTLLIKGDGPSGSVEVAISPASTCALRWDDKPWMTRRRLGRWTPVEPQLPSS